MPRSAASDLGLHCLPMSHKKDAKLICVNALVTFFLLRYGENVVCGAYNQRLPAA